MRERGDWRIGVLVELAQEQQHWHKLGSLSSASVQVQKLRCLPERQLQLVGLQRHLCGADGSNEKSALQALSNGNIDVGNSMSNQRA